MNITEVSYNWKSPLSYGNIPKFIVLHHAEASHCTVSDIHSWHMNNGWCGIGYHFFVDKEGRVFRGRPENAIAAHCPNYNQRSIGICAEGAYMSESMPEVQKRAIIELCKYIVSKYNIPKGNIVRHGDVYSTDCPGTNYPYTQIVSGTFNGSSPSPAPSTNTNSSNSNNDSILNVQKLLNRLHIPDEKGNMLVEDGFDGLHTKNAVKKFQTIMGLPADGIAGNMTLSAIYQILAKRENGNAGYPSIPYASRYIQWYLGIPMDGIFGRATENAVKGWQSKVGLRADGIFGKDCWAKIIG